MNRQVPHVDPDDYFSHTRMSFGDHIEDLRTHLIRAIGGFLIGMILCLFIGAPILRFITHPVQEELKEFYQRRWDRVKEEIKDSPEIKEKLKPQWATAPIKLSSLREALAKLGIEPKPGAADDDPDATIDLELLQKRDETLVLDNEIRKQVGGEPNLVSTSVQESFFIWLKVSFVAGLVLTSPWIFYQIWAFIAAGLYPQEKKLVQVYLPFAIALFLAGVFFAQFFVIRNAVSYLLWFNEWLGIDPLLRLTEWLTFAIVVPLIFGIAFQTPLVMFMLERIGIVSIQMYQKVRRYALFALTLVSAVITPGDLVSMLIMMTVLFVFYELGILLCRFIPRKPSEIDAHANEMIEV